MRARLAAFVFFCATTASAGERVRVLVPDAGNLQYMSFWVAKGAGYLADEGIDVELVVPPGPQQTGLFFTEGKAEVAVLPPPVYVTLLASKVDLVLVANLLANDPIDLVVRRSVLEERKLSPALPLKTRLEGLRGVRLGVAPHPPTRLRALFATEGLDADKEVSLVILHGKEQNAAFREGKVDALYAHTPYLERAILHDDAVVLVDQSRGEVEKLAHRQIHALSVQRSFLGTRRDLVDRFVRAIGRGQDLVHRSSLQTIEVLAREMPDRDRRELETIVRLYEPAIPRSPAVRAEEIPGAVAMFPAGIPVPDLSGVDLSRHVYRPAETSRAWWIVILVAVASLAAVVAALLAKRRPRRG